MPNIAFLVDEQLPVALARWLTGLGFVAEHVSDVGLRSGQDRAIWDYAKLHGRTIITKDEDFRNLAVLESDGPHVVWIRTGNSRRRALLQGLDPLWPMVVARISGGERVVEII